MKESFETTEMMEHSEPGYLKTECCQVISLSFHHIKMIFSHPVPLKKIRLAGPSVSL